jgi:predicted transcriptional regulator
MALIKDRSLGTEERVGSAIGLAHVENLKKVLAKFVINAMTLNKFLTCIQDKF